MTNNKILLKIKELARSISEDVRSHKPIFLKVIKIFIPLLVLFIIFAVVAGYNAGMGRYAINKTFPISRVYSQLERHVMSMQKWITYTSATQNKNGFDTGLGEAENAFQEIAKDLKALRELLADKPDEEKAINELESTISSYYEVGKEVAKAYIEDGTSNGNAMLDVFSIVENKLNTQLQSNIKAYNARTISINNTIRLVLNSITVLFILMGIIGIDLGVVVYMFLVKREELHESNQKLKETMDELWGEMELARKIQTVLLPKHPQITGYDIVGSMTPATEVGGDYYDVINVDNYNWLIIGDVSGHGVTAGLVMMMVQTAIHTALRQHPQIPPKDLLIAINNVIAANIKLLGESKYMTLTVIACLEDGVFNFSGLHLDLMLYRAASKTIEVIETNGIWIGIVKDIEGMNHDHSFSMNKGDVLCLYTDGFTEAVLKTTGALFSEEKLNDILLGLCQSGKTAREVQEGVLAELKQYQIRDDVTMVIMKRL